MKLTPADVQSLVTKSFCLEVLADKKDCTSRYQDLPDKPLEDFVLAGINAAPYFTKMAVDQQAGSKDIYAFLVPALITSNHHKSQKYVNMGLLEVMFNVVAARLRSDDPRHVVKQINTVLKSATTADARALNELRDIGWRTSKNQNKRAILSIPALRTASTPFAYNELLCQLPDHLSASWQWGNEAHHNWPILEEIFQGLRNSKEQSLLNNISNVFNPIREANPDTKIGILADMCAAAIFLYLSFL